MTGVNEPQGIGMPPSTEPGKVLRCNAPDGAPQRQPKAPDSAWGQPRGERGWSLRELAKRTGINAPELSRIERGRSCPTPEQARRILAAYDEAR